MKKKIGYKLVKVSKSNRMFSCAICRNLGGQEYFLNKPTRRIPGNGPLALFRSLKYIKRVLDNSLIGFRWNDYEMRECEYIPTKLKTKTLWNQKSLNYDGKMHILHKLSIPGGTIFADSVTLIKKISQEKILKDT